MSLMNRILQHWQVLVLLELENLKKEKYEQHTHYWQ
jgi:hypothetical protein